MELKGRTINKGTAEGIALVSESPISFYGGVDPETGKITDRENKLCGQSIKDAILVFPFGSGSTVGPYVIYRLKKKGLAPKAIINRECETIVAVGAIIADIPCVDKIDTTKIKTGDRLRVKDGTVTLG
jgi:predicted aconitase with swiveling domain